MKKIPRDIIILQQCVKNYMFGCRVMAQDKQTGYFGPRFAL